MNFLKAQLSRLQQQLAGLSATQKMLAGALVVIMFMTLWWWAKYAAQPEMTPVLDQALSGDDITRITSQLKARGIAYAVVGDKVNVPVERQFEALQDLGYAQLLPRDTKSGFDEIVKQLNPFTPDATNQVMWNHAKEITLAQVIRGFPNVSNAIVLIDPTKQRTIGDPIQPSATINMTMRNGLKPDKRLINAAADVVSGAQAALAKGRITVIVDGVSYPVRDAEDGLMASNDYIELRQQNERYYADKIGDALRFIPGAMVSVHVDMNMKRVHAVSRKVDPNVVQKEKKTQTETEESNNTAPSSGEAGVLPNAGMSVSGGAGGGGSTQTSEKDTTEFENFAGDTTEDTWTAPGEATVTAASIRVPRSYFIGVCKAGAGGKDPDEAAVSALIATELPKIRADVKACTGLKADADVTVETYLDALAMTPAAPQSTSVLPVAISSYGKELALGGLALASLFLVSMIVRKSTPAPVVPKSTEVKAPERLASGETLAGEVGEGSPALDGMEVDDDAIKAQQMLSQVQTMVQENPDVAANLVKRWLNRT